MGWIVIVVIVLLALFAVSIYNGLVTARNAYKNAFAQIDVQLTRRHDLIPNLVETVKGYIAHERRDAGRGDHRAQRRGERAEGRRRQSGRPDRGAAARRRGEGAVRRARPPVRARRGLSGPQGEPAT